MAESNAPGLDVAELLEHSDWLRRLAVHLVRDPTDAEDLTQLAMETALMSPPKHPGPLRPWLGGLLRNLVRMHWRSSSRRRTREQSADVWQPDEPGPDQLLEKARAFEQVARSVTELGEPFREVILLRYFEGLTGAEISRRLEIPAATIRSRLKTGLDRLRAELHRDGERPQWAPLLVPLAPVRVIPFSSKGGAVYSATKGAIVLKSLIKVIGVVAVILAALLATRALGWWGAGTVAESSATAPLGATVSPTAVATANSQPAMPDVGAAIVNRADPLGTLRLEGQVVDDQERPVGGAQVALNTHPSQVVISEEDGSFAFTRLMGRDYAIEASSGRGYAGLVRLRLRDNTEPVILRLEPSRTVKVRVVDESDKPIEGADVELRSQLTWRGQTNEKGELLLSGVGAPDPIVVVSAKGFAREARRLVLLRNEESTQVRLRKGVAVMGRVLDSAGKPVAGARVLASSASEPFVVLEAERDGVETDAKGNWHFKTLARGIYRFSASDHRFATASLPPVSIERAITGLEITLDRGARVSGRVVDNNGKGVSGADVRLVSRGSAHRRTALRTFTGESGTFIVDGIASKQVDVVASHRSGSSEIASVDLEANPNTELVLSLAVTSGISGVVVDSKGAPIAEAQVRVDLQRSASIEDLDAWTVRGHAFQVTDGSGRFSFDGVADGTYRVRASRGDTSRHALWVGDGVDAKPGEEELRIELPSDGVISGTVLFENGEAPALFSLAIGGRSSMPFSGSQKGDFELVAPPGEHTLVVRGPSFADAVLTAKVSEGKETKVGTISVDAGRSISGRVFDSSGRAVAGAEVAAGSILSGDGSKLFIEDESPGGRSTMTDDAGNFVITGFDPGRLTIVAAKDGIGRSVSLTIRSGGESMRVDLILEQVGRLGGTVSLDGKPLADTVVIVNPEVATTSNFFVTTGPDGSFAFDQLAVGKYIVYPMVGGGGGSQRAMYINAATVEAGATATVKVAVKTGSLELEVQVATDAASEGASGVAFAQVFVIGADYSAEHAAMLLDSGQMIRELSLENPVPIFIRQALGGNTTVNKMTPGTYSICAVPVPIDPSNPQAAMKDIRTRMETLPMKCKTIELDRSTSQTVIVPAAWTKPS